MQDPDSGGTVIADHLDQRRFDMSDTIMRQCTGMICHARRVGRERIVVEHGGEHPGRGIARQQPQFASVPLPLGIVAAPE